MNPLMLIDWASVNDAFRALCWLAAVVLATWCLTVGLSDPTPGHRPAPRASVH